MKNFFDRLNEKVKTDPASAAVIYYSDHASGPIECSYRRLISDVARTSEVLDEVCGSRSLVLIIAHEPIEQLKLWLAAIWSGRTPGILTPPTPKLEKQKYRYDLERTLEAYPEAQIIAGKGALTGFEIEDQRLFEWLGLDSQGCGTAELAPAIWSANQSLIFQQSSGTTGARKGMFVSYEKACRHTSIYSEFIQVSGHDKIVSWLPLYHDMGLVACLLTAIYNGIPLVLTSPFVWLKRPAWLFEAIQSHQATLTWMPNFAFKFLMDRVDPSLLAPDTLKSLRMAINCSEPVQATVMDEFSGTFCRAGLRQKVVSSSYAMAENTFAVCQVPPGVAPVIEYVDSEILKNERRAVQSIAGKPFISSGTVMPETELKVTNDGVPCPDGTVGEIHIKGSYRIESYKGVGEDQNAVFLDDGWFATGDIGYERGGNVFVIGRTKDVIVRAGRNYDPGEFEQVLASISHLQPGRWAVFGVFNEQEGTDDIVMLAEKTDEGGDDRLIRKEIVQRCNGSVGLAPQVVRFVPSGWLVKSSSGKISRASCRERYRTLM